MIKGDTFFLLAPCVCWCVCVCVSVVVFLLYQQSVRDHRNSASHTRDDDDDVQRHSILNNDTFQEFFNMVPCQYGFYGFYLVR